MIWKHKSICPSAEKFWLWKHNWPTSLASKMQRAKADKVWNSVLRTILDTPGVTITVTISIPGICHSETERSSEGKIWPIAGLQRLSFKITEVLTPNFNTGYHYWIIWCKCTSKDQTTSSSFVAHSFATTSSRGGYNK